MPAGLARVLAAETDVPVLGAAGDIAWVSAAALRPGARLASSDGTACEALDVEPLVLVACRVSMLDGASIVVADAQRFRVFDRSARRAESRERARQRPRDPRGRRRTAVAEFLPAVELSPGDALRRGDPISPELEARAHELLGEPQRSGYSAIYPGSQEGVVDVVATLGLAGIACRVFRRGPRSWEVRALHPRCASGRASWRLVAGISAAGPAPCMIIRCARAAAGAESHFGQQARLSMLVEVLAGRGLIPVLSTPVAASEIAAPTYGDGVSGSPPAPHLEDD